MVTGDDIAKARVALRRLNEAGQQLEEARALVVLRAEVALAAGAHERVVAEAAGITVATLRRWLAGQARG